MKEQIIYSVYCAHDWSSGFLNFFGIDHSADWKCRRCKIIWARDRNNYGERLGDPPENPIGYVRV